MSVVMGSTLVALQWDGWPASWWQRRWSNQRIVKLELQTFGGFSPSNLVYACQNKLESEDFKVNIAWYHPHSKRHYRAYAAIASMAATLLVALDPLIIRSHQLFRMSSPEVAPTIRVRYSVSFWPHQRVWQCNYRRVGGQKETAIGEPTYPKARIKIR